MRWYRQKIREEDGKEKEREETESEVEARWPAFGPFLRTQLPAALKRPAVARPFLVVAATEVPLARKFAVPTTLMSGLAWHTAPPVWVDQTEHAAFFSKSAGVIVVNRRIVRTFERSPNNQDYRGALEMLMLHELLHWLIHTLGGITEHKGRGQGGDAVYGFEDAAYPDAAARGATLESMNH